MTTLPVGPIVESSADPIIFPHYADGQGWTTQIVLVNSTDQPISGTAEFIGSGGQSLSYNIASRSSTLLRTAGSAGVVHTGWVRVTPANGSRKPAGVLIFSFRRNGITLSEAGVPASPAGAAFRLFVESAGNMNAGQIGSMQTGMAIVNPSGAPVEVTFELTSLAGIPTGAIGRTTLPDQSQVAFFTTEIPGFGALVGPQGLLRISAPSSISVVGLRGRYNERGDFLITTLPPSNEADPPTTTNVFMPHFVDAVGYATQFILFSGSAGQSSSGTLRFFSQNGQSLGLSLR